MTPVGWAQPSVGRDTPRDLAALEQRRAELRLILKEPRSHELPETGHLFENVGYDRHLTAQEKASLRQQLRQQRLDSIQPRP